MKPAYGVTTARAMPLQLKAASFLGVAVRAAHAQKAVLEATAL